MSSRKLSKTLTDNEVNVILLYLTVRFYHRTMIKVQVQLRHCISQCKVTKLNCSVQKCKVVYINSFKMFLHKIQRGHWQILLDSRSS